MHKYLLLVIFLMGGINSFAQLQTAPWDVPADQSGKANTVELTPKSVSEGKNIFMRTCVACHGEKADGKGLILSANLISETVQKQTDGAFFYKISTGRTQMPPFKAMLKETEIWAVVNYLRVLVNPTLVPPAKDVKIELTVNDANKSLAIRVVSADSAKLPVPEMDVHFYVKREFGLQSIGAKSNFTNADGKVIINFSEKIIGDTLGNITIVAKIENNLLFNDAQASVSKKWGVKLETHDAAFNKRSLWGARDKSPVWLLLLANGIILGVWLVILYVVFNLFRMKNSGKIFIK
jgi:mono/diheme cytochrome c family protein